MEFQKWIIVFIRFRKKILLKTEPTAILSEIMMRRVNETP